MTAPLLDFSLDASKVRLLISDIDFADPIFSNGAIDAFLELANGNIKRAAAQALLVIAVNEVLVQKRIRLLDLSTDGPSEAQALKDLAKELREQADLEATGDIGFLELPEGIDPIHERTDAQWYRLQEERDVPWA